MITACGRICGPLNTGEFGLKWKTHPPGPAGDGSWSICLGSKTLSVLVSGHFRIETREYEGGPEETYELTKPGEYILFDSPTQHRSTVVTKSVFLTIRWPSNEGDCGSILTEPWASAAKKAREDRLRAEGKAAE